MVGDVTPLKMSPRGGDMATLRVLPTHTSAVGVSASAKPARVVAGVDMHILYVKIPTGPPQMPRVLEFNGSNGT